MENKFKFDRHKFKLGMRTVKTGIAVFIILSLFHLLGWEGLQIGALTAVFSIRENFDDSIRFGISRIIGNSIGGVLSLLFFVINELLNHNPAVMIFLVPLLTMLAIVTNVSINNKSGVIGSVAALLIITLSIPYGDTIIYVFARILETFCGVFVALLVNYDLDRLRNLIKKH